VPVSSADREEAEKVLQELCLIYHRVFNSEDGKKVLEDMKKAAFFYRSTMSDTDRKCFRNEGAREFVLRIERIVASAENLKKGESKNV
jgi:hypothetical protein